MGTVSDKRYIERINTHFLCSTSFFFSENPAVYEIMWGKKGQSYTACVWHAGFLRLYKCTLEICNTYCFYETTIVPRTPLSAVSMFTFFKFRFGGGEGGRGGLQPAAKYRLQRRSSAASAAHHTAPNLQADIRNKALNMGQSSVSQPL